MYGGGAWWQYAYGSQGTTLCSWFPPSTFTWVPRSEWVLRFALVGRCLCPLNCLPAFLLKRQSHQPRLALNLPCSQRWVAVSLGLQVGVSMCVSQCTVLLPIVILFCNIQNSGQSRSLVLEKKCKIKSQIFSKNQAIQGIIHKYPQVEIISKKKKKKLQKGATKVVKNVTRGSSGPCEPCMCSVLRRHFGSLETGDTGILSHQVAQTQIFCKSSECS